MARKTKANDEQLTIVPEDVARGRAIITPMDCPLPSYGEDGWRVLGYVVNFPLSDNHLGVSVRAIVNVTGIDEMAVQRCLRRLAADGLIRWRALHKGTTTGEYPWFPTPRGRDVLLHFGPSGVTT